VFEFIDGQIPDPRDASVRRRIGQELALCHLAVADFRPVIDPARNEFSDLARLDAVRSTLADSGFDRFLSDVAVFRDRETGFFSELAQLPHGIVHGDLHPHNVLIRGTEVVALLDWGETCMTASFIRDLGQTMLMWSVTEEDSLRPNAEWMRDVREGYEVIRPLMIDENRLLNSAILFACLSDAIRHLTTGVHPGLRAASECGTYLQFLALTQLPVRFV
jgi:Ser/Thr protein kinase RdoA (MazF antagonist)